MSRLKLFVDCLFKDIHVECVPAMGDSISEGVLKEIHKSMFVSFVSFVFAKYCCLIFALLFLCGSIICKNCMY
jgi:hypothetical protein